MNESSVFSNIHIAIFRSGVRISFTSSTNDPTDMGDLFRAACKEAKPGDFMSVGPGLYDVGHLAGNVLLPDNVTIQGYGMDRTKILASVYSDQQGTAFNLQNTTIESLTLQNDIYIKTEDGRTIGFDPLPGQTMPFTANIHNCRLIGNAWTCYSWANLGNTLNIYDTEIISGRVCVSAQGSSGGSSQYFNLYRCKLIGNAALSNDIGATSSAAFGGVYGAIVRGGKVRIIDCEMELTGRPSVSPSFTPNVIGVADTYETGPAGDTKIEILNLRSSVNINGAILAQDLHIMNPTVRSNMRFVGGYGSGPDGVFIKSW